MDKDGTVRANYDYDAWGNHTVTGAQRMLGEMNPFRYRGYYYDTETKLYYLQTRYYDPETGRFLNMDSIDYADPESLNGLNLYAYCNNNPVMYVDPTGHAWWHWALGALIVAALVVATCVSAGSLAGGLVALSFAANVMQLAISAGGAAVSSVGSLYVLSTTGKSGGYWGQKYSNDHLPEHVHLLGNDGTNIRIGVDGKPLPGEPPLKAQQRKALKRLLNELLALFR